MDLRALILGALLYVLFPLWLVAGVADYMLHRRTDIERSSGLKESALHVVQALQVGIALVTCLFLEINALVLAISLICVLAHTFTALWDGLYTDKRRFISPVEQHVHSHLEYLPLVAMLLVVILYWGQFCALFGVGPEPAHFRLMLKEPPVPTKYLVVVLGPIIFLQGGLLMEEFLRCLRASPVARTARDLALNEAARPGILRKSRR